MSEFVAFKKIPRLNRDVVITEKIDGTNASVVIELIDEARAGLTPVGDEVAVVPAFNPEDATSGVVYGVKAGARNNYRQPGKQDNFGWAGWVAANAEALVNLLGPGRHYGEWWGAGIQRRYGLMDKRFSLFNISRYGAIEEYTDPRCTKLQLAAPLKSDSPIHQTHKGVKVCACRETQLAVNVVIGGVLVQPVPVLYTGPWFVGPGGFGYYRAGEPTGAKPGDWAPQVALNALREMGSVAAPGFMQPEGIVVFHEASGQRFKATLEGDEKPKGAA